MSAPFRYTVAVPTMNRPRELRRCLLQAHAQNPAPEATLVVDDGALDPAEIRGWLGADGAAGLIYHRKSQPGLPESIAWIARLSPSPWTLLLDDDIYLEPDFMERMLEALEGAARPETLAGIAGYVVTMGREGGPGRGKRLRWALERVFLLGGGVEGRYFRSGFCTNYDGGRRPAGPYEVEFVPGGLGLWRTEILRKYPYDPWYHGYAAGIDKEMAYRISRDHRLLCQPRARALHEVSPRARLGLRPVARMRTLNQRFFFARHFAQKPGARWRFAWAIAGMLLIQALAALVSPGRAAACLQEGLGILDGLRAPLRQPGERRK